MCHFGGELRLLLLLLKSRKLIQFEANSSVQWDYHSSWKSINLFMNALCSDMFRGIAYSEYGGDGGRNRRSTLFVFD